MATIKTTNEAIEWLIKVLEAELGYLEKASNSNLDAKKTNAGSKNYTKYWLLCKKYQGLAWCAMFCHWCMANAFGKDMAVKLLETANQTGGCYIDPDELSYRAKATKTPKVGSVALFYNGSSYGHTGMVVEVTSSGIYTIEGNTSPSSSQNVSDPSNGGGVYKKYHSFSSMNSNNKYFMPDYSVCIGLEKKTYVEGTVTDTSANTTATETAATVNSASTTTTTTATSTASASTTTSASKEVRCSGNAKSFDKTIAGKYAVNVSDDLKLRDGAGTGYKILLAMTNAQIVYNYGYYTTVNGTKWYMVQTSNGGVLYTGFCSSKYLKKQ